MPDVLDPYAILGLSPGTPKAQVKAQFRRLAKSVHPDRNGSEAAYQERLRRINAAYEFLSDPVRKADYDAYLARQAFPEAAERDFVPVRTADRPSRAVPLFFVLTLLVCVVVLVVCLASQQTLGFSAPVSATAGMGEPVGPAFDPTDGQSFVSPPPDAMPGAAGPNFWPASSVPREPVGDPGGRLPWDRGRSPCLAEQQHRVVPFPVALWMH